MEGLRVAQDRQEEICENPGRPNPYGFLLSPLKNIAILGRPKGWPHGRLQEERAAAAPKDAKVLYFLRKYNKRGDGKSKSFIFMHATNKNDRQMMRK